MLNLQDEHREGITSTIVWLKTTGTLLPARLPRDTNSTKSISSSPQIRRMKMAGGSILTSCIHAQNTNFTIRLLPRSLMILIPNYQEIMITKAT